MSSTAVSHNAAAATSTGTAKSSLEEHLAVFSSKSLSQNAEKFSENVEDKIAAGHVVRQVLVDQPETRDSFRHLAGFEALLRTLDLLVQIFEDDNLKKDPPSGWLYLLRIAFTILAAALGDHKGNCVFFRERVPGGGWDSSYQKLQNLRQSVLDAGHGTSCSPDEHILGCLFACAIEDEAAVHLFKEMQPEGAAEQTTVEKPYLPSEITSDLLTTGADDGASLGTLFEKRLGTASLVQNPEALCIAFQLWLHWHKAAPNATPVRHVSIVQLTLHLARSRAHNLLAIHRTNLLSVLLSFIVDRGFTNTQIDGIRELAALLLTLGTSKLDDARLLYLHAHTSPSVAGLLLHALQSSHSPSCFHFDLSIHGYSSIELPDIGVQFPPTSPSNGYTLSLWFQVTRFDGNAHTTLLGAFDSSQTCFVLVYLEKDSRNLILQTSVTSSRPSVRFKSVAFREGRWYHIAIAHQKPRTTSSSRVSLFVNGSFVEQLKANYPMVSPISKAKAGNTDHDSTNLKSNPVQVFVGTPQDLASRLGKGVVFTQWRMASTHLFGDVLSDDLIAVHYELGPRYHGNYQDCLGSFNTYQAAASLKLRNDSLYSGKEQRSDIILAMESGGGELLPERKIILGLSTAYVFPASKLSMHNEPYIPRFMTRAATKAARNLNFKGHDSLVVNSAIPTVNRALSHSHGHAVLTGDPAILVVRSLDDAAWQLGGCTAVVLDRLDKASDDDAVLCALDCVFESIRDNWRCSEAMERENGFAILSNLIGQKMGIGSRGTHDDSINQSNHQAAGKAKEELALKVLTVLLKFLGFRRDQPEHSVLNNPLAYRVLLVDPDYWRSMPLKVQILYYEQFTAFGVRSKYRSFNAKRLSKMRIIKKWLEALKMDSFMSTTFEHFQTAFRAILTMNMTGDSLRSLAMYITYAFEKACREEQGLREQNHSQSMNKSPNQAPCLEPSKSSDFREDIPDVKLSTEHIAIRMLELFADLVCLPGDINYLMKFTRTVTNKVVVIVSRMLARLLVINGQSYVKRFTEETGGMVILQYRLQRWWFLPSTWRVCFAILLGCDIAGIDFSRSFNLFSLLEDFVADGKCKTLHPEILPVIFALMRNGLKALHGHVSGTPMSQDHKSNSPATPPRKPPPKAQEDLWPPPTADGKKENGIPSISNAIQLPSDYQPASILGTVTRFLTDVHSRSVEFRDFAVSSNYVQELLFTLYPNIVDSRGLDPDTELRARESLVTPGREDVLVRPLSRSSTTSASYVIRTVTTESAPTSLRPRLPSLRRVSSYVLVKSDNTNPQPAPVKSQPTLSSKNESRRIPGTDHSVVEELLEMIIAVYADQILVRKDFLGLGLFMKVPPGIQEHQAFFESYILRNTLIQVGNSIQLDPATLSEPRVLANIQRLAGHLGEAVFEGWFIDGAELVLEFLGSVLDYLQLPDVQRTKNVRLCSHIIATIREVLLRIVLLRLSELDENKQPRETVAFMERLVYWQAVLLAIDDNQKYFLRLFCFLLYAKLVAADHQVKSCAADLWRLFLVHKPEETSQIIKHAVTGRDAELFKIFSKVTEADNETFLAWIDESRKGLDSIFFGGLAKSWADFVSEENHNTEEAAKIRISKRKDRLRQWSSQALARDETIRRHETSCDHWRSNIYSSESIKRQRTMQDQQNAQTFNHTTWGKLKRSLERPCGLLEVPGPLKWQLDQTEGRNRMRLRTTIDLKPHFWEFRPKHEKSRGSSQRRRDTVRSRRSTIGKASSPVPNVSNDLGSKSDETAPSVKQNTSSNSDNGEADNEDDFELIDDTPNGGDYEDKNRKVLRSLHRDDQVEDVHNVSRIVGLEGSEGLLILGKHYLYLLDGLFQRSDGEIVSVSQAPQDERDSYLHMISGHDSGERPIISGKVEQDVRSWRRDEILSISKRRFLFRDVAIELFFDDGRSYLLTTMNTNYRNELCQKLLNKASNTNGGALATVEEGSWRFDSIKDPADHPLSLGSRFTSVFAHHNSNPATRKWMQGDMSNFNYLMHINTLAGRTFNDLTQYPVFPWVLADYTSEDLDLSDPRSYRDLTKPMGCQTPERQADFRERYQSFAEMGDHNAPPFHYGTHYSTAMIVTSYLIRLQPFVQSYLLLQGGSFDHPDRLFYSIEKTWMSASRGNMTDVRELIPEFFYLPEFLLNMNGFGFGQRQGDGETIDKVDLPPWAKGDPKIFIAKNREALESEYVSKNLHHWIDLIFGHKQRGEAALEATNVFHHLSYRGARDLDKIEDPLERLATIGIIHNFGQTPHQVFQRSHPARDDGKHFQKQLDTMAETLTRLPSAVFEIKDRVASLQYSSKLDRLTCSSPSKINIGPAYDKYMEWGFIDGGIRFFSSDTKKMIGLFEHVHVTQISCVLFVDSRTLVTAGEDCVISVWGVAYSSKSVDLQPKGSLFGHRTPITTLTASRSFRTLLSAAEDGQVLLWDLNRLEIVRKLTHGRPVTCAKVHDVNGRIMVCRGQDLSLFTLNGEVLVEQNVCTEEDRVVSCAFYEGSGNDWLKRELVFTGHALGVVNIWNVAIRGGAFVLEHVKRMHHLDQAGYNIKASITCVLPLAQRVYTGDEDGRVVSLPMGRGGMINAD
ncbi:MAG: hypothetical protein Q9188_006861 [Gyalolechia gomerana]